jgi:hypothetical protein
MCSLSASPAPTTSRDRPRSCMPATWTTTAVCKRTVGAVTAVVTSSWHAREIAPMTPHEGLWPAGRSTDDRDH